MSGENPLVSIIVRTKDRPVLLRRALQSVAAQTYRPIEVILVNDGGCDLNLEEIQGLLGDVSLHYKKLDKNKGRPHAGNVGIENSHGNYIGLLDDDDEYYPDHLMTLVSFLEQGSYKVAYTDANIAYLKFNPETMEIISAERKLFSSKDFSYNEFIMDNYIPVNCLLFSREVFTYVKGFDESFDIYEDWDLLLRMAERYPFYHITKTTAEYVQWSSNLQVAQTIKYSEKASDYHKQIINKHRNKFTDEIIRALIQNRRSVHKLIEENEHLKSYISMIEEVIMQKKEMPDVKDMIFQMKMASSMADKVKQHEELIQHLDDIIKNKEFALSQIYTSRGWRLLGSFYKGRDRFFPQDSMRRLSYELLFDIVENPKRVLAGLTKGNIKKFFQQYRLKAGQASGDIATKVDETLYSVAHFPPSQKRNNILVIDRFVPTYDKDSGSLRMFSFLRILSDLGYRVTFLPDDLQATQPYFSDLQKMGIEVLSGNIDVEKYLANIGSMFTYVIISRPEQTSKYIPLIRAYAHNSIIGYDTVDLHWLRFERAAAVNGDQDLHEKAKYFKSLELCNASCSDVVFTVTKDEKEFLLKELPEANVAVIPNIHSVIREVKPFRERRDIMFIGSFLHHPNEDAVLFFVNEIFPLLRKKIPDMRFFVVGSDPMESILKLDSDAIKVTGYVRDVAPYFKNCRVFVAPLRFGAGMKGKIGQSMAYGLPVVTTIIGAEGIGLVQNETALIADQPEKFADSVLRLYTDEQLWDNISLNSIAHIERNYSREAVGRTISDIFNALVHQEKGESFKDVLA
jgi:glycosyltransferase involved in cell wall biosynthesis